MPGLPMIRVNGKTFTRNSCAVRVNAVSRIIGVDSIEWSDETPYELVPGMNDGGPPVAKAQGNYTCAASISILADEATNFETLVMATSPLALASFNLSLATFQLAVVLREDVRTRSITIINCNIKGRPGRSVGNDGSSLIAQYDLQPTLITENGLALVNLTPAL